MGSPDPQGDARDAEEAAWQDIVTHFGERAQLDDEDEELPDRATGPAARVELTATEMGPWEAEEERFVPPEPPAGPTPSLRDPKSIAWFGVLVVPTFLVVCAVLGLGLPGIVGVFLVGWSLGSFVYLVATMPRGSDRDPWDDGSRV